MHGNVIWMEARRIVHRLTLLASLVVAMCVHATAAPVEEQPRQGSQSVDLATEGDGVPGKESTDQGASGLTLTTLETMALANNQALQESLAKVSASRGNWTQVGLAPNPVIGYSGQQLGSGVAEQNGMFLGQEIVRGNKLGLNRAVAEREIAVAEQRVAISRQRVLTDVRMAYYDLLVTQQRRAILQELVNVSHSALTTAEALLRAQSGSQVDILQARVEVEQAKIALQNADNKYTAVWREMSAVVGQPLPIQDLSGSLDQLPPTVHWDDAMDRLLTESPELAVALVSLERAERQLQRECVESKPNVTVEGIVQHDNSLNAANANVQVTFPIPVRNRNQGAIRAARAEITAAKHALERTRASLSQRLAPVYERYSNAANQVDKFATDILPAAEKSLELTHEGYRSGEFGFLTLLTAQRTYFQTRIAYLDAHRELWLSVTEIDGLLLTKSLADDQ